jgi:hypothetical protein
MLLARNSHIVRERSDGVAAVAVKPFHQHLAAIFLVSEAVDAVAESHANQAEAHMVGECRAVLEVSTRKRIHVGIRAQFVDGGHIRVDASIVCPVPISQLNPSIAAKDQGLGTCSNEPPQTRRMLLATPRAEK